jgi:GTP-binding protein HflX
MSFLLAIFRTIQGEHAGELFFHFQTTYPMTKKRMHDITPKRPRAILIGVSTPKQSVHATKAHLEELQELAYTAEIEVIKHFTQRLDHLETKTVIGSGKVKEIADFIKENNINRVVFDDNLTPLQTKSLEDTWKCEVWDRSLLILAIFAMHARTKQAKVQVELAQYQYLMPRLVGMWTHLSRQQGGVGMRGPGEKELETDRRAAQKKMSLLKQRLADIAQIGETQRKQRKDKVSVTLVGYTNAGKSTIMQRLSREETLIEDKLFATLSPTVRKVVLNDIPFLLTDTVGFIRKLPHELVECFKSTLAEVREADILLHIVDFSHPEYEDHITVVHEVLEEIGAGHIPMILVLNKDDKVDTILKNSGRDNENDDKVVFFVAEKERLETKFQMPVIYCSALKQENMEVLRKSVIREVTEKHKKRFPERYMTS